MMKLLVVMALLGFAAALTTHSEQQYQFLFKNWVKQHSKQYHPEEFMPRYDNFKENLEFVKEHNLKNTSFKLSVNHFADMTQEEFRAKYLGYKMVDRSFLRGKNTPVELNQVRVALPSSVDWNSAGAVTPVKNQGQCGSCWAFSTTGATEGAWFLAKNSLVSLSEQQLVDCSGAQGNQGCNGGLMDQAFQYIISNGGLCSEADYPYTGQDGTCNTSCKKVVTISKFVDVKVNDETALQTASAQQPIAIAIEADQSVFQFYSSGVLDDASCGVNLDHGVLLTGYGTDSGKDYWTVKNSWGASWGAAGYIKIVRNVNGNWARQCGLTSDPSYPVA
jgi:C1A family cysteine protease